MDHETIASELWIERYVAGRLPPAEAERFEEHFLDCRPCLDELEAARSLRRGLAAVAVEEGMRAAVAGAAGRSLLARLVRSRLAPWAVTAAALLLLVPAMGNRERGRELRGELERARGELRDRRAAEGAAAARGRAAERESERLAAELARAARPQANPLVLPLAAERSGEGEPARRLVLPASPAWVVLTLDLGPADAPPPYRAQLRRGGRAVIEVEGLKPTPAGQLSLLLRSTVLPPGDYTVEVTAAGGGRAGRFAFRVER